MTFKLPATLLTAACMPFGAEAQELADAPRQATAPALSDEDGPVVYEAAFYAQFQPQTALDMLMRTPGFVLIAPEADEMLRGFSANAANVLIDGQRPTVKSGGLAAYLGRIAAARVQRIELLRGAQTGEAQGQTLVANLVLAQGAGSSGNASFELRRAPGEKVTPKLEASYAFQAGEWQLSAGLIAYYETNPLAGRYTLFDPEGRQTAELREAFRQNERNGTLTGSAERALAGGTLTVNGRFSATKERYRQALAPISGAADASLVEGDEAARDHEIGADWVRPLGRGWTAKLVTLARGQRNEDAEAFSDEAGGTSSFDQLSRTREYIARGVASRDSAHWLRPELSFEAAWNRLDSRLAFVENGEPVDLPGSDVTVTELRGELAASLTARLTGKLRAEAGLNFERSQIDVGGDDGLENELSFLKPAFAIVWDADASTQLRLGWRRTAGQLDLDGFAASTTLIDDRPIAGNAELRPEVTDAWSLKADRRFGDGGALSLTLARERIKDALAYVPLASGDEALLNFGTVKLWSLSGEATVPLGRWLNGARLTANGTLVRAHRSDPIGGGRRDDSRDYRELDIGFRHDLTRWRSAYGFSIEFDSRERDWYVAEYEESHFRPYATAYVESTALIPDIKVTLTFSGVTGDRVRRERRFFFPDRSGLPTGSETRVRQRGAYVNLLFSRQF